MSKFVKIYENGTVKRFLTFLGNEFVETLSLWDSNKVGEPKEKWFKNQIKEKFPDIILDIEELEEALDLISSSDAYDIEEGLEILEEIEIGWSDVINDQSRSN